MKPIDLLVKFLQLFPMYHEQIHAYTPAGEFTLVIDFKDGKQYKFVYFNDNNWTFGRYHV